LRERGPRQTPFRHRRRQLATQPNGGHQLSRKAAVSFFMTAQRRGVFQVTLLRRLHL
jgi:hypothetical protein